MKPTLALRLATFCILFFIGGHTIGHITRKDAADPKARQVFALMEEYKFPIGNQFRSYDEFYTGMSLNLIASLMVFALLLWVASEIAGKEPGACNKILFPVLLGTIAYTITGFLYFFVVPALTCLIASLLIAYSLYQLNKSGRKSMEKSITGYSSAQSSFSRAS